MIYGVIRPLNTCQSGLYSLYMKWDVALRIIGVLALVGFAVLEGQLELGNRALLLLVVGVIAIVMPEALDALPFGPSKE